MFTETRGHWGYVARNRVTVGSWKQKYKGFLSESAEAGRTLRNLRRRTSMVSEKMVWVSVGVTLVR